MKDNVWICSNCDRIYDCPIQCCEFHSIDEYKISSIKRYKEALEEISVPKVAYVEDHVQYCHNVIEHIKEVAKEALKE